ncbi:MAG: hypothetical protein LBQ60_20645 [Bacteroidales bacterium]|nr:hypothetical protein [Bacteroidales bacterium]
MRYKIFIVCLFTGLLYACKDNDSNEDQTPYFGIEAKELDQSFVSAYDLKYVTVKTNQEFTAIPADPWCTVEVVDDKIDNLKIIVTENDGTNDRNTQITVQAAGFENFTINVSQRGLPYIVAEETDVLITDGNLEFTLNISSNISYAIELPEWITEKVGQTNTFVAKALAPGERSGQIVIKSTEVGVQERTSIPVKQETLNTYKIATWDFEDAFNLGKATLGKNLEMVFNTASYPNAAFTQVEGPTAENKAVRIPLNCHFLADLALGPKQGEDYISEYTLFFEFKFPEVGKFYSFYQTNLTNTGDAEIFVRSSNPATIGVGATGYHGSGKVLPGVWNRLYLSVKPGDFKFFLNGEQIGSSTTSDTRFRIDLNGVILCGGPWTKTDDNEFDIAQISVWNGALTLNQVKELEGN